MRGDWGVSERGIGGVTGGGGGGGVGGGSERGDWGRE